MEAAVISLDGQIDLIDQAQSPDRDSASADRQRASRLIDVMIVLEREKASIEEALTARFADDVLSDGIERLAFVLHEDEPKFSVTINRVGDAETSSRLTLPQRAELENEAVEVVVAAIEKHAAYSEVPRWQPRVTATYRTSPKGPSGMNSVWLRTLFWLLAIVVLGVAYLYLKQPMN